MEITLAMRVLDAMASELEALKERIGTAEARIKALERGCSCATWREHTGIPRTGDVEWEVRLRPDAGDAGDVSGNSALETD